MVFLDKYGWPVVRIRRRRFGNLLRLLIHTRRIVRGRWDGYRVVRRGADMNKNEVKEVETIARRMVLESLRHMENEAISEGQPISEFERAIRREANRLQGDAGAETEQGT